MVSFTPFSPVSLFQFCIDLSFGLFNGRATKGWQLAKRFKRLYFGYTISDCLYFLQFWFDIFWRNWARLIAHQKNGCVVFLELRFIVV